ncbi:VOC family protein [Mesorhizobium sp. M0051]|uniref:VOC family protein n=1 Tax=unclassified Mesorhizobium TaxID=325217 RepID=UPI001FD93B6E|nr:VOC family protein [Mesorhizobium sp. LNHC252B00]
MLEHIFLTANDTARSIAFYERILPILGITARVDYDGKDGPAGHPDLKGFVSKGRMFFWLRRDTATPGAVHVGFVDDSEAMVNSPQCRSLGGRRDRDPRTGTAASLRSPLLCGAGQRPGRLQPRIRLQELAAPELKR